MTAQMQNPGVQAGASRDQLCGQFSLTKLTALERQAQMLACRFCLSPSMARDLARLCFGEPCHD